MKFSTRFSWLRFKINKFRGGDEPTVDASSAITLRTALTVPLRFLGQHTSKQCRLSYVVSYLDYSSKKYDIPRLSVGFDSAFCQPLDFSWGEEDTLASISTEINWRSSDCLQFQGGGWWPFTFTEASSTVHLYYLQIASREWSHKVGHNRNCSDVCPFWSREHVQCYRKVHLLLYSSVSFNIITFYFS